jgi:hypothetical protein
MNKNVLKGYLDLKMNEWDDFIIRNISYFSKGNDNRWIAFPSREYEKEGKKQYYSMNCFEDKAKMKDFQEKVFKLLDVYLKEEKSPPFFEQEEIPF